MYDITLRDDFEVLTGSSLQQRQLPVIFVVFTLWKAYWFSKNKVTAGGVLSFPNVNILYILGCKSFILHCDWMEPSLNNNPIDSMTHPSW